MKKFLISFVAAVLMLVILSAGIPAFAAEVDFTSSGEDETAGENVPEEQPEESGLPEKYSSYDLGWCTGVKNQLGKLCWAYASAAVYETYLLKNNLYTADIAPLVLDSWGTKRDDGSGWQRNEYEAGYTYIALGNFTSWNGPETVLGEKVPLGVTSARYLHKEKPDEIKRAIMNSGGVCANFNADNLGYSADKSSFFMPQTSRSINGHTVEIIGWDDNYPKENFTGSFSPATNGAWLCKNSWGETFNPLGGYMWISYGDYYLFNNDSFPPSYNIESAQTITENDSIYQNEIYGATYEFEYGESDSKIYFNVFDFSENGNVLDKVVFETTARGADYTVYYTPVDENGAPVSDKSRWSKLGSGVVDFDGYICCDFEDKTISRTKGAIGIEINTERCNESVETEDKKLNGCLGVTEWLRNRVTKGMIFVDSIQPKKCYFTDGGAIEDMYDIYHYKLGDDWGGTLVIKAITNGSTDTKIRGDVNLDGVTDISDATLIQKYIAGMLNDLGDDQLSNADMNLDGEINIMDVTAIQKFLLTK